MTPSVDGRQARQTGGNDSTHASSTAPHQGTTQKILEMREIKGAEEQVDLEIFAGRGSGGRDGVEGGWGWMHRQALEREHRKRARDYGGGLGGGYRGICGLNKEKGIQREEGGGVGKERRERESGDEEMRRGKGKKRRSFR